MYLESIADGISEVVLAEGSLQAISDVGVSILVQWNLRKDGTGERESTLLGHSPVRGTFSAKVSRN
jgi:hypothetical protein